MGLVKSATVTEKKVTANRQNAQHSTGPRSEAGKQNSSLNGLVHGLYSNTRTYGAMIVLGEDPLDFESLRARLHRRWGFGLDPLIDVETDELAWLLWRKQRVERSRDCMLVARKEHADTEGRRREREHVRDSVDLEEASRIGLRRMKDSPAAFEQTLTVLDVLTEDAERRDFAHDHATHIAFLYGGETNGQGTTIKHLFRQLAQPAEASEKRSREEERKVLLQALEMEREQVVEEYLQFRRDHIELTPWVKGAMLAPDEETRWMVREAASLDRAIDRKIKLLMDLRKELREQRRWEREEAEDRARETEDRSRETEAEARGQGSGVRGQEPDAGTQETQARNQESEGRSQEPVAASLPRQPRKQSNARRSPTAGDSPVAVATEGAVPSSEAPESADETGGTDADVEHGEYL